MTEKRIDYVVVLDKKIKTSQNLPCVEKFTKHLEGNGLIVEIKQGNITDNIFIMIHLPMPVLHYYANVYNVNISNSGHTFLPQSSTNIFDSRFSRTPLSQNKDFFKRESNIATNTERIQIAHEILMDAKFGEGENDYGIDEMIRLGIVKAAYPLHDGSFSREDDEGDSALHIPENDRQLLLKYWANFSLWYKQQPLNLIEKYFGSEVAFYFAWLGFYNKMLIPAAVTGLICSIISIIRLVFTLQERVDDICTSKLLMCPLCHSDKSCKFVPLNISCTYAKGSIIFDNRETAFFAVFMSFWATLFTTLWKRFENILKIRWNVDFEHIDTKIRRQYKERSKNKRISHLTGELEPFTPVTQKALYLVLSYGTCLLLLGVVASFVFGVIMYRVTMNILIRKSGVLTLQVHAYFFLTATSACLQMFFIKLFGMFYEQLSEWLTYLENPRTQSEFDNSVIQKRYFLGFANNYASLFYIAFVKGRFFSPAEKTSAIGYETDICHPTGCLMGLCVQLSVLMLFKSLFGNIFTLIVPKITKQIRREKKRIENQEQWEMEYKLIPASRYLLTTEFMEMIVNYGFVTFFVAAFPLAPLCALINNCLELRLDAYKLVTRYRRPVPKKDSGIGKWNGILDVITHLSIATNAFVLAFTSDFVGREIYKYTVDSSLDGYIRSTLSIYDMNDYKGPVSDEIATNEMNNSTLCYYKALRHPPGHPNEYQLSPNHWYLTGMKLLCVIIFEHIIMLTNGIIAYFIPIVPQTVKETLHYEHTKELELKLKLHMDTSKKVRKRKTTLKIQRSQISHIA